MLYTTPIVAVRPAQYFIAGWRKWADHLNKTLPAWAALLLCVATQPACAGVKVTASSAQDTAHLAVDGNAGDESRWVSEAGDQAWLVFEFDAPRRIVAVDVTSGWQGSNFVPSWRIQVERDGEWVTPAGGHLEQASAALERVVLEAPVTAKRVRFFTDKPGHLNRARVAEIEFWDRAPEPLPFSPFRAEPGRHIAAVNLSGYDSLWPMRFTAPQSPDGSVFEVVDPKTNKVYFAGKVRGGVGDFSALAEKLTPADREVDLVVRLRGGGLAEGVSDAFRVAPNWLLDVNLELALQGMVDFRSIVGSHPSGFNGSAWRDGAFYTYEVPSLVMMYLAHPDFFMSVPSEIDHARDKAKLFAPGFKMVTHSNPHGEHALAGARGYYTTVDPPIGRSVPDIVDLIHWGVGFYLAHPTIYDLTQNKRFVLHEQVVEWFAYYLYVDPLLAEHFPRSFYKRCEDFAFDNWEKVGLYGVFTKVGGFKGRRPPGHSILPNLLMAEVSKRTGRGDPERFIQAAADQTRWVIDHIDLTDPVFSKGQRMSEHVLPTALAAFLEMYPDRAPKGTRKLLEDYAKASIARSDNMWDFRRYDEKNWGLPIKNPRGIQAGGAGWNEPGNLPAFSAACFVLGDQLPDLRPALDRLAASHYDNLWGRNPLRCHTSGKRWADFFGVERGWPKKYPDDTCARLEFVRGSIDASCATDHYPFNPGPIRRHTEGWVAFNTALNVSYAYAARRNITLAALDEAGRPVERIGPGQTLTVRVRAPEGYPNRRIDRLTIAVNDTGSVVCKRVSPGVFEGTLKATGPLTLRYGHGFMKNELVLPAR